MLKIARVKAVQNALSLQFTDESVFFQDKYRIRVSGAYAPANSTDNNDEVPIEVSTVSKTLAGEVRLPGQWGLTSRG